MKCGIDWGCVEESNGGVKSRVRFRDGQNRNKENSPATASFFALFRPNRSSIGRIEAVYMFVESGRVILESLTANGGREHLLRRPAAMAVPNYSLVPHRLEMVKWLHRGFVFSIANPEVSKPCSLNLEVLKLLKTDLF